MAVLKVTKENFQAEVLDEFGSVLVDFFATWCGPCKMLSPILDGMAAKLETTGKAKICKVDVDDQQELAAQFGVMSIPTMIVFENGKPTKQVVGTKPEDEIWALLGQ